MVVLYFHLYYFKSSFTLIFSFNFYNCHRGVEMIVTLYT